MEDARQLDRVQQTITAIPETVYLARTLIDQAAIKWLIPDDAQYVAKVVITELVTNAVKLYRGRAITAWLAPSPVAPGVIELAVWDPDASRLPTIGVAADDAESGRGLAIVYELSGGRLGWYRSPTIGGKIVWARIGP